MWITKQEKKLYNDCKYNGLRLQFLGVFNNDEIKKIKKFCRWLTCNYWFPIRCKLYICAQRKFQSKEDGHTYYGIFYSNEDRKKCKYPSICVAACIEKQDDEYFCYFTIAHELSHYFQWYFFDNEIKTERSLEIMANKWAKEIVWFYQNKR